MSLTDAQIAQHTGYDLRAARRGAELSSRRNTAPDIYLIRSLDERGYWRRAHALSAAIWVPLGAASVWTEPILDPYHDGQRQPTGRWRWVRYKAYGQVSSRDS